MEEARNNIHKHIPITYQFIIIPVKGDLPLVVANPVDDVEGGETEGEHYPGQLVNPRVQKM